MMPVQISILVVVIQFSEPVPRRVSLAARSALQAGIALV